MICHDRRLILHEGRSLRLPRAQFNVCAYLAQRPGFVRSRDNIMVAIWPDGRVVTDRTIDGHVKLARRAMNETFGRHWIMTAPGVGYYWEPLTRREMGFALVTKRLEA